MIFFLFRNFFSDKSQNIFFCRAKCEIFFQNLTLGYMTKTLNQIIFFPPPKSEYFFQEKTRPLPPFKLNGRSLMGYVLAPIALIVGLCIGHVKPKTIKLLYVLPLCETSSIKGYETSWVGNSMCQSGATCPPTHCVSMSQHYQISN